jgi:hypothetical protein
MQTGFCCVSFADSNKCVATQLQSGVHLPSSKLVTVRAALICYIRPKGIGQRAFLHTS